MLYTKEQFVDELCNFSLELGLPVDAIGRIKRLEDHYYKGAFEIFKKYGASGSESEKNPKVFVIPMVDMLGKPVIMVEYETYANGRKRKLSLIGQNAKTWKTKERNKTEPTEFTAYRVYNKAMKHWLRYPIKRYLECEKDEQKLVFYMVEMPYEYLRKNISDLREQDDDAKMLISVDELISGNISWESEASIAFAKLVTDQIDSHI